MFNKIKKYTAAPIPFQGQKRAFISEYAKALSKFPNNATYIDLFGGSGLLSHVAKYVHPDSRVIWNDHDDFRRRLQAIPETNILLKALRPVVKNIPVKSRLSNASKEAVIAIIREHVNRYGYADYITLSGSLMFSGKYAKSIEEYASPSMQLYNRMRKSSISAEGYLEGVERVKYDFMELYSQFQHLDNVIFILDPPYLTTDVSSYNKSEYWRLSDYLNVLELIEDKKYIYFSSAKSGIVELMEWFGKTKLTGNPFAQAIKKSRQNQINNRDSYEDLMLFKTK